MKRDAEAADVEYIKQEILIESEVLDFYRIILKGYIEINGETSMEEYLGIHLRGIVLEMQKEVVWREHLKKRKI